MKTTIKAEIVAHSINEQGDELISVMATFPRFILAEVNTHRMLSKNTSSSRAIPFDKMVKTIQEDPFIPMAWQKNHSGMQGSQYHEDTEQGIRFATNTWLRAMNSALKEATTLNKNCDVTKQLANRLLEPFMWTTMLITGPKSGWDNFFNLRCPVYEITDERAQTTTYKSRKDFNRASSEKDGANFNEEDDLHWLKMNKGQAEIHMMALAECIWDVYNESKPEKLEAGEWHIPFRSKIDFEELGSASAHYFNKGGKVLTASNAAVAVSVAMAARTSYTVVGEEKDVDYETMIGLHDRLLAWDPPHSSPLEHAAKCMYEDEYNTFHKGRLTDLSSTMEGLHPTYNKDKGWCNNFKGFIPYRYMVDNGKVD